MSSTPSAHPAACYTCLINPEIDAAVAKEAERVVPRLLFDVLGWWLLPFAALLWSLREIAPDLALGHKLASGNSRIV
jgi:hypothetical protein